MERIEVLHWLSALEKSKGSFPDFERVDHRLSMVYRLEKGVLLAVLPTGPLGRGEYIRLEQELPAIPGVVLNAKIKSMIKAANRTFLKTQGVSLSGWDSLGGFELAMSKRLDHLPPDRELRTILDELYVSAFSTWTTLSVVLVGREFPDLG